MRPPSVVWICRKLIEWSSVAGKTLIGIVTNPNDTAPLHTGRGMAYLPGVPPGVGSSLGQVLLECPGQPAFSNRTRIRFMDAEEWRAKAGPWARATMPDEQELDVILTQWTRTADGQWWAECEAILPARYQHPDGRTRVTGAPTPISVPSERITPIPGEDYALVPIDGAVAGRQWVLEKLHQYSEDAPSRRLHRRDCWQARDSHERIATQDAARMLAQPAAGGCGACRADRA